MILLGGSPDFSPSNFHPFSLLEVALRGRPFADVDELKHGVHEELRRFGKEFYATGLQRLMSRWKECVDNEQDFVDT
jgi:hypothetical protein